MKDISTIVIYLVAGDLRISLYHLITSYFLYHCGNRDPTPRVKVGRGSIGNLKREREYIGPSPQGERESELCK